MYRGQAGFHHNIILTKYVVIDGPRQEQHTALFVFTAVMRSKCQELNWEPRPTLHDISLYSGEREGARLARDDCLEITFPVTGRGRGR